MPWAHDSRRRSELPPDWPATRRRILKRDGYRCRIRLPGCKGRATDVDHIDDPTDHRPSNLRAACGWCHGRRTSAQGLQAKGHGPLRQRPPDPHPGILS